VHAWSEHCLGSVDPAAVHAGWLQVWRRFVHLFWPSVVLLEKLPERRPSLRSPHRRCELVQRGQGVMGSWLIGCIHILLFLGASYTQSNLIGNSRGRWNWQKLFSCTLWLGRAEQSFLLVVLWEGWMHFRTLKAFLFLFCVYFIFISQQQDASLIYFHKRQVLTWSVTYFFLILDLSTVCIKKLEGKNSA